MEHVTYVSKPAQEYQMTYTQLYNCMYLCMFLLQAHTVDGDDIQTVVQLYIIKLPAWEKYRN